MHKHFRNKNQNTNEMVYANLLTKIELIKTICGELCDTDAIRHKPIRVNDDFHYIPPVGSNLLTTHIVPPKWVWSKNG